MGYLNKATITIDAILTNRGRELLAEGGTGTNGFQITKFAVADDEIDYSLYNLNHPNGSTYAGNVIENMPLLEATPDESQIMRYKLITIDPNTESDFVSQTTGTVVIPRIIDFGSTDQASVTSTSNFAPTPNTSPSTNPEENYVLFVANANLLNIYVTTGAKTSTSEKANSSAKINANGSITLPVTAGQTITFEKKNISTTGTTSATLFGDLTGATKTITITVS